MLDSGAQPVPVNQQVCRYYYRDQFSGGNTTSVTVLKTLYLGEDNISDLLFDTWYDAGSVNWVQLRRVEVNLIPEDPAPAVGAENYYIKLVFDVFQSPLTP